MITLDLVEFIEKEEKNGTSREKIKSELLSAGWLAEDIEEGFLKVAPAYTPAPKKIESVVPKIQTTFIPVADPVSVPIEKVDIEIPEVKDSQPEVPANSIQAPVQPAAPAAVVAPKIVDPVPEIVKPEIKIEPEVKIEAPKIDPYREVVKDDKPIENSFSASVPPSNLPKVWTPSNIPIISSENTEVIPRLIPKKVEPIVPPKAVLPQIRTPERKAELAKVYQQPVAQAPVAPIGSPVVENLPPKIVPPVEPVISPASVATPPTVNPVEIPVVPPVVNPSPASNSNQKPPYMVFAKQELSKPKPIPGPSTAPYSPNSAVTSSYPRDAARNFVFEEKKPGIPRFIVGVFIFIAVACILGGVAFAYMTGLIDIPFLPKINQTAVTAKYIDPIVNNKNNQIQDQSQIVLNDIAPEDVSNTINSGDIIVDSTQVILPTIEELKAKDKITEDYISSMELQIYKKYALNKNQYGIKPNTKGDCLAPEKDSLFYTDPKDTSSTTITTVLNSILGNTENKGSCFSTTKAWAVSFPSFSESESYICVDSSNKKIKTKIALTSTVCK